MWFMYDSGKHIQEQQILKNVEDGKTIFSDCCEGSDSSDKTNEIAPHRTQSGFSFFNMVASLVPCIPRFEQVNDEDLKKSPIYK
jgi:hypothetical protein